ncbi:unnamed protein product, partial [Ectocarpus sp. 12 AP-2014]
WGYQGYGHLVEPEEGAEPVEKEKLAEHILAHPALKRQSKQWKAGLANEANRYRKEREAAERELASERKRRAVAKRAEARLKKAADARERR